MAKVPQGCPWEVFLAYAQAEWRIYRSETNALRALRIAYLRYRLHVHFLVAYVDFLVGIGRLDAARELFRISVCTLQREKGTGSALLWRKWIRLELRYGDMSTLQGVIHLRAQQRAQLSLDDASLLQSSVELDGAPLGASGAGLPSGEAASRHRAEMAVLCNRNSVAHAEGGGKEKGADATTVEKDDVARAKVAVRKRQFMGGDGLNEIADCYHMLGHLAPRSSLLRSFFADAEEAEPTAEEALAAVFGEADMERDGVDDGDEAETQREAERRGGGRRRGARHGKPRKGESEDPDAKALTASGVLPAQDPHGKVETETRMGDGAASAGGGSPTAGTGAGYASKLLAETAKRKFAETAAAALPEKEDAEAGPVEPPQALCDLIALLPKNDMRNFVDADLVDYTMVALAGLELPEVPESERVPIQVKDLLALRHSQLQCFRAMQIQQQAIAAVQKSPKAPVASGPGAEASCAGAAADEEQDAESRTGPSPSPFPDRRSSSQPRSFFGHRRRAEGTRDGRGRSRASADVLSSALSDISSGDDEAPTPPDLEFYGGASGELAEQAYLHPIVHPPGQAVGAGGPAPWPATLAHAASGLPPPARYGGARQPQVAGVRALQAAGAYPVPHQHLLYPGQEFLVAPGSIHVRSAVGREAFVPGAIGPVFPSAAGGSVPPGWVVPGGPPPGSLHDPHLAAGVIPGAVPFAHLYPQMHPVPNPMAAVALGAPRHDVPPGWPAAPSFLGGLFGGAPLPKATRRRVEPE
ncbi:conserved hypothetical protein [Neospora caninum Liverpool]|uniref:mRNA 3'-end-processing protein RNA14 n=1 Tax=Neospora caninum (strain Liverpool) TaxID=572307 RepID=F0VHS1_NEOCL|nr:conserved hypothetical protein [Neospora caninum Liverpool]CBZ53282.1 conserved hypothetical protein [Neospora caninum Liverpool]CEL67268.1 TPA: mRNA 3'-end-processing protein RNA14 [Neospora caninum Liverpool]|eukprot:XP_003883314.1 conserved hypothetical protein [Neospora caninum Liverpool]